MKSLFQLKRLALKDYFGLQPKGLAFAFCKSLDNTPGKTFLDFGCRNGDFIGMLSKQLKQHFFIGIDLDKDSLKQAESNYKDFNIKWVNTKKGCRLPVENSSVDVVTMIGVLEHISDKKSALMEINRVLKPDGIAYIHVPGKHLFSFLDMGNFKFIFPNLHKFYYVRKYGSEKYDYKYRNNPFGLVGDIEKELSWHDHFSYKQFSEISSHTNFRIVANGGMGFFNRIFINLKYFLPSFLKILINQLINIDNLLFTKTEVYFILKPTRIV
tara:strand:- start:1938 stop:2744 length:807 start_codon:yes stop_codon:yes gene_type:complete